MWYCRLLWLLSSSLSLFVIALSLLDVVAIVVVVAVVTVVATATFSVVLAFLQK